MNRQIEMNYSNDYCFDLQNIIDRHNVVIRQLKNGVDWQSFWGLLICISGITWFATNSPSLFERQTVDANVAGRNVSNAFLVSYLRLGRTTNLSRIVADLSFFQLINIKV